MQWHTDHQTSRTLQIGVPVLIEDRDGLYFAGTFRRTKDLSLVFQSTDGAWTFAFTDFVAYTYITAR